MDLQTLTSIRDGLWLYLAGPLLLIAALALSVRLRGPQFRRLPDAFRTLRKPGSGEGTTAPALAALFSAAATFGAAAVVGAATAVSLAGPGALPYLWLFGILLGPVYYAETLFAKTDAPGGGDPAASGSVPRRLMRMGGAWRIVGFVAVALVLLTALLWGGAVHASALAEATHELLPGSTPVLVGAAAVLGVLLAIGEAKTTSLIGWLGLAGFAVIAVASIWGIAADPGRAFGALGQSFGAAIEGAPQAGDFTGALVGEVAFAAVLFLLPANASGLGISGSLEALSRGRVRTQAALALLTPLFFAGVATMLVMAFVGTGAFSERVEGSRRLLDTHFYAVNAETANERLDEARLYDGFVRIREGQPRNPNLLVGSERGMIREARYEYNGRSADIALQVREGESFRLMRNSGPQTLDDVAASNLWRATVHGQMLPKGGTLAVTAGRKAGGDLAARILLAALLALAAVAFAGFAVGAARALPAGAPLAARAGVALLPALGAGLALGGWIPGLPLLGAIAVALLAVLVAVVLLLRTSELAKLDPPAASEAKAAPEKKKA